MACAEVDSFSRGLPCGEMFVLHPLEGLMFVQSILTLLQILGSIADFVSNMRGCSG
jgi:hypothetical protein